MLLLGLVLLSGFVAQPASAFPEPPMSLEQACAGADLIVVGTLGGIAEEKSPEQKVGHLPRMIGSITVQSVLYGHPPEGGVKIWAWDVLPPGQPLPACSGPCPCVGKEGKEWIWCLNKLPDGVWRVDHTQKVIMTDKKGEIEKAVQARLAPERALLEKAPAVDLCHTGLILDGLLEVSPAGQAYVRLLKAGPAALPCARELLMACKNPAARAWGCLLLGNLQSGRQGVDALKSLLDSSDRVPLDFDGMETVGTMRKGDSLTLGVVALQSLGTLAGEEFKTVQEAKAWCDAQTKGK